MSRLNIRVSEELRRRLRQMEADLDCRSLQVLTERLLTEAVEAHERRRPPAPAPDAPDA